MPFFSNIFKGKEGHSRKHGKQNGIVTEAPAKPRWEDAWQRKEVDPEEVQELLRCCTYEIKSRGEYIEKAGYLLHVGSTNSTLAPMLI